MNTVTEVPGRVTIGIPTRNRCNLVLRAIQSTLAQTYTNVEVVVSDNASTDDTAKAIEEIRDPRLVLIKQAKNIGMTGNFNACLNSASGEFFLMLSDDDILEPEAIEELTRPFFNPPETIPTESIGMVWCPCMIVDIAGKVLYRTAGGPVRETVPELLAAAFNGDRGMRFNSVLVRTADARMAGGYKEDRYGAICDTANWAQSALQHDYAICVNNALAKYTIHTSSETSKSACRDWQNWAEAVHADILAAVRQRGDRNGEKLIQAAHRNLIASVTITILMQVIGQPGWIRYWCREVFYARKYLFSGYTVRRLIRDGWKFVSLRYKSMS